MKDLSPASRGLALKHSTLRYDLEVEINDGEAIKPRQQKTFSLSLISAADYRQSH